MTRLLVVGGSGFVGNAVSRALDASREVRVRWTVHHTMPVVTGPGDDVVRADLTDPSTVRGLTRGCDAVIHLGHRIAGEPAELAAVNDTGAGLLAYEAERSGARLVALSTAAVYGPGPWTGQDIHSLPERPASEVSRTRLAGDRRVRAAGGVVVRPHLVIGPGDRWVLPRAADLVAEFGWDLCGTARHSAVTVDDLAGQLLTAATGPVHRPGAVRLAAGPEPVDLRPAIDAHLATTGRRAARSAPAAALQARAVADRRLAHDLALLGNDHVLACRCDGR